MKKLLLAAAIIALTCAHAHANPMTLPDEMLGKWCVVMGGARDGEERYVRATEVMSDYCMMLTRTGKHSSRRYPDCVFTNTQRRRSSNNLVGVSEYLVSMDCEIRKGGVSSGTYFFQLIGD
jgi:hypothetical protein